MSNKETTLIEGDVKIIASLDPSIYGTGRLDIAGDLAVSGTIIGSVVGDHGGLAGLTDDDHLQYALLAGRSGGQTLIGGTAASDILTIRSTSNATKGSIILDETTISTSTVTGSLRLAGSIGISNTTDAVSSINGGTFTTAGGLAVAKKVFIGTDLNVSGTATITNLLAPHSGLNGLLDDDHTQYALLSGRSTGQILTGGNDISNNLILRSTSNGIKGSVILDETTLSNSSMTGSLILAGGIGISSSIDAISSSNGGTFTTAGGIAIGKKAFIGTDLNVNGTATITSLIAPHSGLTGLLNDDHTQYPLIIGRSGGQSLTGGVNVGDNLILSSTSNPIKGSVILDETTISTSSTTGSLRLAGSLCISNTTDAVSSTNGGTFTTAGGISVAKKAFIGTDLRVGGTTLLNSYYQTVNISTPTDPPINNIRFYTDTEDSLLKSKNSTGIVTVYQPTNTKGDLLTHNGTTQIKLPTGTNNQYLRSNNVTSSGLEWVSTSAFNNNYIIRYELTVGTNGGTNVASAWTQIILNTISTFPSGITDVTLATNNITCNAGSYFISVEKMFLKTDSTRLRLFNVTDGTVIQTGLSHYNHNDDNQVTKLTTIFTLPSTKTLRIEYFAARVENVRGLGSASGIGTENYTTIIIKKLE